MKIIYVDGYNVINSWPNLKNEKEITLQSGREKLIDIMHNYGSYNNCKVIIVFDAHKVSGSIEKKESYNKNVDIVFTKDGETADGYIERAVHEIGRSHEVYVVTSDSLEQQTVFQRGAVRISSIEFYNEVMDTEIRIGIKTRKNNVGHRNNLADNVDENILAKLEMIRRSK